jgi:hypothetical protein
VFGVVLSLKLLEIAGSRRAFARISSVPLGRRLPALARAETISIVAVGQLRERWGSRRAQHRRTRRPVMLHGMDIDSLRDGFSMKTWFGEWVAALAAPASTDAQRWPSPLRRLVAEALSDAAAEQFLNPLVAQHLRRYGASVAGASTDRQFWVRSEWDKVDLSYGFARPFEGSVGAWDRAWREGATGDVGQCEVKVIYAHRPQGVMKTLAGQLEERRARDVSYAAPDAAKLRYHGLVWLFEHGDGTALGDLIDRVKEEAVALNLAHVAEAPVMVDDLGMLWPSTGGNPYRCAMSVALLEFPNSAIPTAPAVSGR